MSGGGNDFLLDVFKIAGKHQSWEVLVAIGRRLIDEGEGTPLVFSYLYDAFRHLNRTMNAKEALEEGISAFPDSPEILLKMARFASDQHDFGCAAEKWLLVHKAVPEALECYLSGSICLEKIGDLGGALDLLKAGAQRYPENTEIQRRSREIDANIRAAEMRDILTSFESLGGRHEGCEFGMVQRHYQLEPLGLLRWADMTPDDLIAALEHGFEGVGDPANTFLRPPQDGGDWLIADTRFGMKMHTFLLDEDTAENRARILRAMCQRMRFLAREMLEDLAAAEKVFVYKVTYENLGQDRLDRLHRAIRMHGPSTLLYVRQSDPAHPAGTVVIEAPGLMVGYIERFSFDFGPNPRYLGATPESWAPVIMEAHRLWRNSNSFEPGDLLQPAEIRGVKQLIP